MPDKWPDEGLDWQRIEQLYHEACSLPESEHAAFLAKMCGDQVALRREVESLLAARDERGDFLRSSLMGQMASVLETDASGQAAVRLAPAQLRELLRECAACGECGDGEAEICPRCGAPLATLLPVERTVAGRYRIERRIGKGGMGTVYQATDLSLRRAVALKVLSAAFFGDEIALRRFEREARAAARLHHPNVVRIYDHGATATGGAWLALEFVEGITLREEMKRAERLPLPAVCDWFEQIAAGIKAAHDAGIIHRDLKPENIMLVEAQGGQRQVCILDFGLARLLRTDDAAWSEVRNLTAPGLVIGTPAYMAPEQFSGEADERTDIFALGVMLAEMLTGQHPFQRGNYQDTRQAIAQEPYHLTGTDAAVGRLDAALQKCLAKEPGKRYTRVAELQEELLPILRGCPPEFIASQNKSRGRSTRWMIAMSAGALVVFAGWYFLNQRPDDLTLMPVADWKLEQNENDSSYRISPDEQKIAFTKGENGQIDLYVKPLKGGEAVRLTNDPWFDAEPLWSPDGKQLLYYSTRNGKQELWRIPSQGGPGELIKVMSDRYLAFLRWSQDGRRIYYTTACDLHTLDLLTGEVNVLTNFERNKCLVRDVSLSLDERWIAYTEEAGGIRHVWAKDVQGGTPVQVTHEREDDQGTLWHPDGKRIIYGCKRNGIRQICAGYLNGRAPTQLTFGQANLTPWYINKDGQRILYQTTHGNADLFRLNVRTGNELRFSQKTIPGLELNPAFSADGETLFYQEADEQTYPLHGAIWSRDNKQNSPAVRVAEDAFDPRWSPQQQKLAFLRWHGESGALWTINRDGTQAQAVVKEGVFFGGLLTPPFHWNYTANYSWSPDGRRLAYVATVSRILNVWTIGNDGNDLQNLSQNADPSAKFFCPLWSPDQSRLVYLTYSVVPDTRIWKIVSAEAGQRRTLYQSDKRLRLLGWSPTGSELFFVSWENVTPGQITEIQISRLAVETGQTTQIAKVPATYFVSALLAPDDRQVALTRRINERDELWVVSTMDGSSRQLAVSDTPSIYLAGLAWAPDANSLYFSKQSSAFALWAIDNFR